jgi:transcriptional regulator of acetoin/glycerol metabolism
VGGRRSDHRDWAPQESLAKFNRYCKKRQGTTSAAPARFTLSQSRRKDGPFVPVECSAMPGSLIESELSGYERGAFTGAERTKKVLIESADGGTLFLDEIGDLGEGSCAVIFIAAATLCIAGETASVVR